MQQAQDPERRTVRPAPRPPEVLQFVQHLARQVRRVPQPEQRVDRTCVALETRLRQALEVDEKAPARTIPVHAAASPAMPGNRFFFFMPAAHRSPTRFTRCTTFSMVKSIGLRSFVSSVHLSGVDTDAYVSARAE